MVYATVAYRASDGTQMWVARHDGPGGATDIPRTVFQQAVSGKGPLAAHHRSHAPSSPSARDDCSDPRHRIRL